MIDKRFIEYKANSYKEDQQPTLMAAGPSETMTDAGPTRIELTGMATPDKTPKVGRAGVPYQTPSLKDAAAVGGAMLDMGASAVKGATQGFIGLPGDIEGIGRLILGKMGVNVDEATALPTTEEVKTWLDTNLGAVGDGKNPYESIGEVVAPGGQVKAAKVVAKSAKALAPKAAEMVMDVTEKTGMPVRGLGITEPAPRMVISDFTETTFKAKTADEGAAIRFKNPLTLKDGSRLSGFTNPKKQNVFFGYDKNGELFTIGREYVNPEDIVSSKDTNKTADRVKQGLEYLGEYKARISTSQQEPK